MLGFDACLLYSAAMFGCGVDGEDDRFEAGVFEPMSDDVADQRFGIHSFGQLGNDVVARLSRTPRRSSLAGA